MIEIKSIQAQVKSRFSHKFDIELWAIATIYFVQGAMGLSHLSVSFFLKDQLKLSPAEVASLIGIAMVPWTIKPLYGMISDAFPIFGYRRRPYLVLSSLLGVMAWACMATIVNSAGLAMVMIAIASMAIACFDAIIDALVVQRARLESEGDAGSLQAFSWAAMSVGGITSAYFSGFLLEHWGAKFVFAITAGLPLLVTLAAFAIADPPINQSESVFETTKQQFKQLVTACTSKQIWLPMLFIFLWQATPSADSAFFFFTTNELKFNPEFLGTVRFFTSLAGLGGIWIFQRFLKDIPMRRIFLWTTLIATGLGMTSLVLISHVNRSWGIDDRWFSLGDSLILTVAGRIAYMPVLILAARLCPEGIEATLFALLMSVMNLASLCSSQLGAGLTYLLGVTDVNFKNLGLLVTIANLSNLLPLPLLGWLPNEKVVQVVAQPSIEATKLEPINPEFVGSIPEVNLISK
ncbi:folate/biopterin transporter [Synechococcus sp. PCC 7502]|uniref:folate/biopterin family MFS transporter n=1 Tax=Synechococcus sp. PCC 7502 TaxID=1173263 RepID=UPI00029FCDB7|nr:folate/biopterin family MFS transporter [Synechococcus sp. PCC 7502]AFY72534.1 folate/biopterin transporter [Synechococcus sp. PCC 7502]